MTKTEILNWLKINDWNYSNNEYTINDDSSIDVKGTVNISYKKLTYIPIKFNIVTGSFSCTYNELTSLENCPHTVNGDFWCDYNNLISLKGIGCINGNLYCDEELYDDVFYKSFKLLKQLQK